MRTKKPKAAPPPPPKPPKAPRPPMSPEAKARVTKVVLNGLLTVLFTGVVGVAFEASERYVATIDKADRTPAVVLADKPAWMNDAWAAAVADAARPAGPSLPGDRDVLQSAAAALAECPWVKQVNSVRRTYRDAPGDTIVLDCQYRTPAALVRWQDAYWYVDQDGVRLPERLSATQVRELTREGGRPLFRVIDGCGHAPDRPGHVWPGKDVQAGLELAVLLADKPYADQVTRIDVGNFDGRVNANESQINLVTRYNTEVRWGQPPSSRAFFVEQRVDRKLDVMAQACRQTGRVDMNLPWIDLRFDSPTAPAHAALDVGR